MRNSFLLVALLLLAPPTDARSEFLAPMKRTKTYGCSTLRKIVRVDKNGGQHTLSKADAQKFVKGQGKYNKISKQTRTDGNACLRGRLRMPDPCKEITASQIETKVWDGRVCDDAISSVVKVIAPVGQENENCSGVVVHRRGVLTAAHCIPGYWNYDAALIKVRTSLGEYPAEYVGYNGNYAGGASYDVAYILLKADMTGVRPVPILSRFEMPRAGEQALIAGFGRGEDGVSGDLVAGYTSIAGSMSDVVQTRYTGKPGESATCNGDSGGPLLVKRGGVWKLAAVTSSGTTGCKPPNDMSFTSVTHENNFWLLADSMCVYDGPIPTGECPFDLN